MNRLWQSFQEGGFGMWFILVFGVLAVVGAARFAWRGDHRLLGFIRWMLFTTASSSALGFVAAMMAVFQYLVGKAKPDELVLILFTGTREALTTLALGLLMMTFTCLLLAIGHRRFAMPHSA